MKYASYRGSWGERSCPRSTTASHSVALNWTRNLPIERRTLYHWVVAATAKSSSPMPGWQEMLWCAIGALLRNQRYEKKDWASLDYLPWFQAKIFIRFWEEGQYKPKRAGALMFFVCGRMSSLSSVQSTFDWNYWNGFVWRGRCRDLGTIGPQVSMPVNRGRRKNFRPPAKMFWT